MPAEHPSHGLLAVFLITRPKSGPKLVFHYPALPVQRHGHLLNHQRHQDSDDDSDDDDDAHPSETKKPPTHESRYNGSADDSLALAANSRILGHTADTLEKLLSPGRWSDRKKFEVCLDGTTFVGHPIYADENDSWSTKNPTSGQAKLSQPAGESRIGDTDHVLTPVADDALVSSPSTKPPPDFTHVSESLDSHPGPSLATSFASNSTTAAAPVEALTMFHVVFALRHNTQDDTRMVYEHVAKKLSKALQYCQKRQDYLAVESRKLVALRTKARQNATDAQSVLNSMIEGSELAWSLKETYEKIAVGGVAGIRLNGTEMSLHIPPQLSLPESEHDATFTTPFSEHSALLLLEDKPSLLRELSHPEASPLAHFIREHTPTKSLQKLSSRLTTPLPELLSLSNHLIKWRKARPVSPLHSRNTYVVAPSAPIDRLPGLIPLYAKRFPALPTLPQMLKVLSGRPIQYGLLIPSKDHRTPYMDILAFLLRHGIVVHLRIFGWLRAPSRDVDAAAENGKPDAGNKAKRRPVSGLSLLSPQLKPVHEGRDEEDLGDDDAASTTSRATAVTAIPTIAENKSTAAHATPLAPHATINHSTTLLLNPSNPSPETEQTIQQILTSIQDQELRAFLPTLLKYFDGLHAFEDLAGVEGLKRARVEEWLDHLQKRGLVQTFRAV